MNSPWRQYARQNGFRLPSRLLRPESRDGNTEAILPRENEQTDHKRHNPLPFLLSLDNLANKGESLLRGHFFTSKTTRTPTVEEPCL